MHQFIIPDNLLFIIKVIVYSICLFYFIKLIFYIKIIPICSAAMLLYLLLFLYIIKNIIYNIFFSEYKAHRCPRTLNCKGRKFITLFPWLTEIWNLLAETIVDRMENWLLMGPFAERTERAITGGTIGRIDDLLKG